MPGKSDINPATNKQYAVNPATGVWDDTYWAEVVEPSLRGGSGGGGSGDFGVDKILEAYKQRQEERNRLVNEFNSKNPFVYDEILATKTLEAKEQLDPYYTQTLTDYLSGVTRTRSRGLEDEKRLLDELQTDTGNYTDRNKENVDLALEKAKEGSSQAGLFNSGMAERQQGLIQKDSNQNLGDFLTNAQRRQGNIQQTTQRNLEDLQREESLKTRDLAREQSVQTGLLSNDLTREAGTKRGYALSQYLGPLGDSNDNYDILQGGLL